MTSSRGRYSLTAPTRSHSSPSTSTISHPISFSQQQQRPGRRDPITITKGAGTSSISSAISNSSSSSASSSSSHQYQNHHDIPSAFRRSMSPIGEAAFAMRNFLRRKRGNTSDGNNHISVDMEVATQQHQQHQHHHHQRPSLTMQSFVLVGGADTTTIAKTAASPTVIYDIDTGCFSDPESIPVSSSGSRCQSPVPNTKTSNLSSSSPSSASSTFSQAMKSRFGRERNPTSPTTPTPTSTPTTLGRSTSFRRSRSRNPSAPGPETTLSNDSATGGGGGTGLLAATAASMRKKLNRRSISADNLPFSSSLPSPSSLPRPPKTKRRAQAQKLANAQGGTGEVGALGGISIGMKDSGGAGGGGQGGGTVAFQDARSGSAPRQQQGANNINTESDGGRNTKNNRNAAAETLSININSSRDGDDDDVDPMDGGDSTSKSDELSSSVDAADMSTPVDRLEDEDKYTTTSSRAAEKKRLQKQHKIKLLQQNSIEFLSIEHVRSRPRDVLSLSNPPTQSLSKILRRRSDSTLVSSGIGSSAAASRSCVALNTTLALEDLEREIDALKAKEALLQGNVGSFSAVDHKAKSTDDCRQRGLKSPSRREAKILLVSSSALPTQFYDSAKTRNVLRTYLTSSGLEFDEMIEYGFPSEAFMDDDDDDSNTHSEDPSSSQQKAAAELAPSCRFLTLRITLTPWHARADESTLYGPGTTTGRQLQFKAMVNRFFSRSGNTTTTVMMGTPLSSPSSLALVGGTGGTAAPRIRPRTLSTSVSMSALDTATGSARDASTSRPPSRAAESRNTSRANSRASSPRRDRSSPPSSYRGSPAATNDHPCGSSSTPLSSSHTLSPNYVSSRVPSITKEEDHSPRVGRRLFSPTPSSHSMIPLPVGTSSTSQPPRKGSLSALSLPLGSQQQQQQQPSSSTSSSGHAPIVPPRRKGSTPALFFTPPPPSSSTPNPRSASSTDRKVYPSPSTRAAQTYGFSAPSRRPSDQSDTISTSLASARGLNNSGSGAGYLREKASLDTEQQSKRQHPRYPHSIHIKQQQQQTAPLSPSTPSPSPCPSSNSCSGKSRQGSHSRFPILGHHQQQHPISLPFSEQDSEEQIYDCYHVAGLDNIYKNTISRTQPTAEKMIHPFQDVPHQSSQQHQHQHSVRHEINLLHISARRDGKGGDEGRGGQLSSSSTMPGGAAEQTPLSAAPPRIQAKNQRRRGGSSCDGSSTTNTSRNGPTGATDRDRVRQQNYTNVTMKREEGEMGECEVHVGDRSFDNAPPVDGSEDLDDEEETKVAAARIGGYWRPIECHQTSTMKTFAFP